MSAVVMRRLDEIGEIQTGMTPPKSNPDLFGTDILFAKPPDLNHSLLTETTDGISREGSAFARVLSPPVILVCCIGVLGKTGLANTEIAFNQQINAIKPAKDRAVARFVWHASRSDGFQKTLSHLASSTTVSIVNKTKFCGIEIPLPPLDEQRRIAETLDTADGIRRRHLQARDEAKALLAALSAREFTRLEEDAAVPKVRLGDVVTDRTGGQVKIKKGDYLMNGRVPVIDQGASAVAGYVDDTQACAEVDLPAVLFGDHTRRFKYVDFPFARGADGTQIIQSNDDRLSQAQFYFALINVDLSNYAYARHFKFLKDQEIIVPDEVIGKKFTEIVENKFAQIKNIRGQIDQLTRARDLLLPRLMDGRISV